MSDDNVLNILGQDESPDNKMLEAVEVNVILYEESLFAMLDKLQQEKKKGNHSVVIDSGGVSFQICASDSEKLREFAEKHGK
jgi:hypothetical protein